MKILLSATLALFFLGCNDAQEPKHKEPEAIKKEEKPSGIKSTIAPVKPVTGKSLYAKCVSCHGADASKKALGKSQIIKGWSSEKLISALEGYQNGTYGSEMKGVMAAQVKELNAVDISILSNYISKL
jgi:cytochrome c553